MNQMSVVYKSLEEIKPYEKNPRRNDAAVEKVAASIREFGFKVPIILDRNNVIVAGHTRYKAAESLGMDKVPCLIADDLTEEQIKAFRLADNKVAEFATWDFERLEEELAGLELDMESFGFVEPSDIDWASVEDLEEKNYDPPEHEMLECPYCHHIDRKIHFKKVNGVETEENQNMDE